MLIRDALIGGTFAIWFALLVIRQCGLWKRLVGRRDPFRLFPRWFLFTGVGGQQDLQLWVRLRLPDGSFTDWVEKGGKRRSPLSALWNPDLLPAQAERDCLRRVIGLRGDLAALQRSGAWAVIRDSAIEDARNRGAVSAQFRITASRQHDPEFVVDTLIVSPLFP